MKSLCTTSISDQVLVDHRKTRVKINTNHTDVTLLDFNESKHVSPVASLVSLSTFTLALTGELNTYEVTNSNSTFLSVWKNVG